MEEGEASEREGGVTVSVREGGVSVREGWGE